VGGSDSGEECFLVEIDSVEHREGESVIPEENVNSNETEDREVTEVVVERNRTVFSSGGSVVKEGYTKSAI